jgi:nucleoside-diphosphate-sugar epimerase
MGTHSCRNGGSGFSRVLCYWRQWFHCEPSYGPPSRTRPHGTWRGGKQQSPPNARSQVHGTVRSLARADKVDHLRCLPGAAERLKLFEADLLDPRSFDTAIRGCEGVFHTASPFFTSAPKDPDEELLRPAREGTLAVLDACERALPSVKAVVVTSSMAAVLGKDAEPGHVWSSADWSDADRLRSRSRWYPLSKTAAELAAWDWHEEHGRPFRLATVNPTLVVGPLLQPVMNESSGFFAAYARGTRSEFPPGCMSFVDVRDVALLHMLVMENDKASGTKATALASGTGRYIAVAESIPWETALDAFRANLPEEIASKVTRTAAAGDKESPTLYDTSTSTALGFKWIPAVQTIADLAKDATFLKLLTSSA